MYILILFGSLVLMTYIKLELREEININDLKFNIIYLLLREKESRANV